MSHTVPHAPDPILGDRFVQALAYAIELHADQARKGTVTPYLAHLLGVCGLVLEDGGTEDEAIAALLHDGPEDRGGHATLEAINDRFGGEVAAMVEGLSDTLVKPKPEWRTRKEAYLTRLHDEPPSVLRISLADKLQNLRTIAADLELVGERLWDRFNAGREAQAWYYRSMLEAFEARLPGSRHLPELRRLVAEVFAAG